MTLFQTNLETLVNITKAFAKLGARLKVVADPALSSHLGARAGGAGDSTGC